MLKMSILAIVGALVCGCVGAKVVQDVVGWQKVYSVLWVAKADVVIDGKLDEGVWGKCQLLDDFTLPWEEGVAAQRTEFRAFCDSEHFYFGFKAWEKTPVIVEAWSGKETLVAEDRVEIYFSPDGTMANYYCLEIDMLGRVLDYQCSQDERGPAARRADRSWNCEGLEVAATRGGEGDDAFYIVEGRIPLKTLRAWGMPEDMMSVGLFRADLERGGDGKIVSHWITWVKANTEKANFHVASAFGLFKIQKQ
ncbi:MAG: carbohydrate-binding family 9-like protein [Phycisphaerales bacterium]|nr:carbohydrate-binding family 9-like protein [Phycisphaerales bacterium]